MPLPAREGLLDVRQQVLKIQKIIDKMCDFIACIVLFFVPSIGKSPAFFEFGFYLMQGGKLIIHQERCEG